MPNNNPPLAYFKTQGELVDLYVSNSCCTTYGTTCCFYEQALIHAYELGAMHHSEDENFELSEFDNSYEQEANHEKN